MKKFKIFLLAALFSLGLMIIEGQAAPVKIENGKKVKFDYTFTVDGQVIESSTGKAPLEYTQGDGKLIPGLTSQLEGLHVGDQKKVTVKPEDAYGQINPKAFQEMPKSSVPADFTPEMGMVVQLKGPNGEVVPAVISEIKDQSIVLDFNHPLAGKTLQFDVKIVSIE